MAAKTVTQDIDLKTGEQTIHMEGYVGHSCEEVQKLIEEIFGKADHEDKTREYYQAVTTANRQQIGGR